MVGLNKILFLISYCQFLYGEPFMRTLTQFKLCSIWSRGYGEAIDTKIKFSIVLKETFCYDGRSNLT
jgi:hypothetical protein